MKTILLTFDVEKFTIPEEHGVQADDAENFNIGSKGLERIIGILEQFNISSTFFVTYAFFKRFPDQIKNIAGSGHEIALHCYEHTDDYSVMDRDLAYKRLNQARDDIERHIGKKIKGFRPPKFRMPADELVKKLGFRYTSSSHPNIFQPISLFRSYEDDVPISTLLTLPISWIWFRNLSLGYIRISTSLIPKKINLYFHPWEFVEVNCSKNLISYLSTRKTGDIFSDKLIRYIKWARKRGYRFQTISEYLSI